MDERLRELQRATEASPSDAEAARRYERALAGSGETAALRARFRFKFECPLRFEELDSSDDPAERYCRRCEHSVRYVSEVDQLADAVSKGQCVAFCEADLEHVFERLAREESLHGASEPTRPCAVPFDRPRVVPLEDPALEPALVGLFRRAFLYEHSVVPLRLERDALHVAWASSDAPTEDFLATLMGESGAHSVKLAFATPEDVADALATLPLRPPRAPRMGIVRRVPNQLPLPGDPAPGAPPPLA